MGVVITDQRRREEFFEVLYSGAVDCLNSKGEVQDKKKMNHKNIERRKQFNHWEDVQGEDEGEVEEKVVCVTSAASFLGLSIVNQLLARGYTVRALIDKPEDMEKLLREMGISSSELNNASTQPAGRDNIGDREAGRIGRTAGNSDSHRMLKIYEATPMDGDRLYGCFEGCRGVFHTSSFIDPIGSSGYSKAMAEIEKKGSENIMEACIRASTVKKCVLTSSLLACIWQEFEGAVSDSTSAVVSEDSWSAESVCTNRKLWYALGKLKAEKAAWRLAEQTDTNMKLATICPGLITGPSYKQSNPTATVAYLKGSQDMYAQGLLAAVDVTRLAQAHICVYESMTKSSVCIARNGGRRRYISFDRVIRTEEEAEKLSQEIGINTCREEDNPLNYERLWSLSNAKLCRIMTSSQKRCCNYRSLLL